MSGEYVDSFRELFITEDYVSINSTAVNNEKEFLTYKRQNLLSVSDFYNRLMKSVSLKGVVLPRNCRYVDTIENGYKILVIEDPPAVRTVNVDMDFNAEEESFKITGRDKVVKFKDLISSKKPYRMTLSFPYVIYMLMFSNINCFYKMKVFYRLSPISSPYDYLLLANLPNIGGSQIVCLGNLQSKYDTIQDGSNAVIEAFWANSFNTDYITNYLKYGKDVPEFRDFVMWAYNTLTDPMFVFNVKYFQHERNIQKECIQFFKEASPQGTYDDARIQKIFTNLVSPSTKVIDGNLFSTRTGSIDSCFIKNKAISIGDIITIKDKPYYINDIITDSNTGTVVHLSLEDENGKIEEIKVSDLPKDAYEIKEPVIDKVKLADGSEVTVGDYIVIEYPFKKIRTIEKIRLGRDGNIEVLLKGDNSDYYLLDKIGAKKLGDVTPKVSGIEVNKNVNYILYRKSDEIFKYFANVKYDNFEISQDGIVVVRFNENKEILSQSQTPRRWRVYDSSTCVTNEWVLIKKEDAKPLDSRTLRIINKLYQCKDKDIYTSDSGLLFDERKYAGKAHTYNSEEAINDLLQVNGTKLFIPSYDSNIEFNVGDDIVVADWDNIYNMVTPRKIHSFVYDSQCLFIVSLDPDTGVFLKSKYIDFKNNMVYIGSIRRIDLNVKNLEYGTLITAANTGIQNFPKKDINKIIGVISDTISHPPMVLCSNGLTIWADELDQFNLIRKGEKGYNQAFSKIVPAVGKEDIREQLGDLYIVNDKNNKMDTIMFSKTIPGDYAYKTHTYLVNVAYPLEKNSYTARNSLTIPNITKSLEGYGVKRYGIYRPRYSEKRKSLTKLVFAYPNLLGGYNTISKQFKLYEK